MKIDPRKNLYLFMISGFLLIVAGLAIRQGGVMHVVLGGIVALGALGVFAGLIIYFFQQTKRRSH